MDLETVDVWCPGAIKNPAGGLCPSKSLSAQVAYTASSLASELRVEEKCLFPLPVPSLLDYFEGIMEKRFTGGISLCIQFFYPNSVGSFPGDSDMLGCLRSVLCQNTQNQLIPLNQKERLGTLYCMGDLYPITIQMHKGKHLGDVSPVQSI